MPTDPLWPDARWQEPGALKDGTAGNGMYAACEQATCPRDAAYEVVTGPASYGMSLGIYCEAHAVLKALVHPYIRTMRPTRAYAAHITQEWM